MENVTHNLKMLQTTTTLRPRVFLSSEKSKILSSNTWNEAIEKIKRVTNIEYNEFIEEINKTSKTDAVKFYKLANNILKYKTKSKIVNRIKVNGEIQTKKNPTKSE